MIQFPNEHLKREITKMADALSSSHGGDDGLDIRFGPDVEFNFLDQGQNIFNRDYSDLDYHEREDQKYAFLKQLIGRLHKAGVLKSSREGAHIDAQQVEFCMKPEDALTTCENYLKAQQVIQHMADEMGVEAEYVSAHWHLSVSKDGKDYLRIGEKKHDHRYSDFHKRLAANIIGMQQLFPALFIRPEVAEQDDGVRDFNHPDYDRSYNGPRRLAYNGTDSKASVRRGNILSQFMTVEPRLFTHPPYLPTYLCLLAIDKTLEGAKISSPNMYPNGVAFTDGDWISGKFNKVVSEDTPKVRRGVGGFAEMIAETQESLNTTDILPDDLGEALISAIEDDYNAKVLSLDTEKPSPNTPQIKTPQHM